MGKVIQFPKVNFEPAPNREVITLFELMKRSDNNFVKDFKNRLNREKNKPRVVK